MLDCLQFILVYNLLWDGFQLYPYVLTVAHQAAILEILDVKSEKLAPGVDTVLLNKILVVTSPAHCVAFAMSNSRLSPLTVRRTQWVSIVCVLISATIQPYVTVFPFGTLPLGKKKVVLFPFGMRVPTPWDGLTRSLVNAFIVILAHGPCNHCLYSCDIPVMISMTVLASN